MALLDRFRARPAWQSPDPQVRVDAVRQLGAEQSNVVASIARDDADPRVRRAAVQRLDDPAALAERAKDDGDESVRQEAATRLLHMAEVAEEPAVPAAAMAGLGDARHPTALAAAARLPSARAAAPAVSSTLGRARAWSLRRPFRASPRRKRLRCRPSRLLLRPRRRTRSRRSPRPRRATSGLPRRNRCPWRPRLPRNPIRGSGSGKSASRSARSWKVSRARRPSTTW